MNNKTIKNAKDVLRRMEEIINDTGAGGPGASETAKPSLIDKIRAGSKLGKLRK